jgi:stage V sporulation protein D (sporulation-specific penicillin-binding protein)
MNLGETVHLTKLKGEYRSRIYNKKKLVIYFFAIFIIFILLGIRIGYVMIFRSRHYAGLAQELHERERQIKAARGKLVDRNGVVIASNETVCTVSVIYNQIKEPEKVIQVLSDTLGMSQDDIRKKVEKISVREKIKSNISKETGDLIRSYDLDGVKVDEDYKRYYPYGTLASKVLGFTGSDNQGIIGLEVEYEDYLKGTDGEILTQTDARGIELDQVVEGRKEAIAGQNLLLALDVNIQQYAQQAAEKVMEEKSAGYVSIIVMNPQNGEIYAMVNNPEFDLNHPYELNSETDAARGTEEYQNLLNKMWRNQCINDTYEPGSTFKIVTATAGLEEGVVSLDSTFSCPGYRMVEDRRIKCHKTTGHGSETFVQATMNSCNPVFIDVGLRIGPERFYYYLQKLGLMEKTGVDLPGEAGTIIHKLENVGQVEMATMSFGQSFQITPLQLLRAVSAVINGGMLITPHFAVGTCDDEGNLLEAFEYPMVEQTVSSQTSENMKYILTQVVSEGGGKNGQVEGYNVGGKTATSEKLPRGNGKYISSYIGFAPADDPQVIAICLINEPVGIYYGGTIAAPVISSLYEDVLPYLEIKKAQ